MCWKRLVIRSCRLRILSYKHLKVLRFLTNVYIILWLFITESTVRRFHGFRQRGSIGGGCLFSLLRYFKTKISFESLSWSKRDVGGGGDNKQVSTLLKNKMITIGSWVTTLAMIIRKPQGTDGIYRSTVACWRALHETIWNPHFWLVYLNLPRLSIMTF